MQKFKFNPPTRKHCNICEELSKNEIISITDSHSGKASSASNFPVHNWYYFVLGYSPEFPDFILKKENISKQHFVVDPFMGSGTTLVACKEKGIPSAGVEANDYFIDVAEVKLNWNLDLKKVEKYKNKILKNTLKVYEQYKSKNDNIVQDDLFHGEATLFWEDYADRQRPEMLTQRYMCDIPFSKFDLLKTEVKKVVKDEKLKRFFNLSLSSIILQISNVRYGPGFGVSKPKVDRDVLNIFTKKIDRMIEDSIKKKSLGISAKSDVVHGDARFISEYFELNG